MGQTPGVGHLAMGEGVIQLRGDVVGVPMLGNVLGEGFFSPRGVCIIMSTLIVDLSSESRGVAYSSSARDKTPNACLLNLGGFPCSLMYGYFLMMLGVRNIGINTTPLVPPRVGFASILNRGGRVRRRSRGHPHPLG